MVACGGDTQDGVFTRIVGFVGNQTLLIPSPSPPSQFTKEKYGYKGRAEAEEHADESPITFWPASNTVTVSATWSWSPFPEAGSRTYPLGSQHVLT